MGAAGSHGLALVRTVPGVALEADLTAPGDAKHVLVAFELLTGQKVWERPVRSPAP